MKKISERVVVGLCILVVLVVWTGELKAELLKPLKLHINFMPVSVHHGQYSDRMVNEEHRGVGVSVDIDNGYEAGLIHFRNSFGVDGFMLYGTVQFMDDCVVCPGAGLGYAPMYNLTGQVPILPWISVGYGWVSLWYVPDVVTALVISVPLGK